ncbi:diguanylate cyclase [Fervidicella metallireducens AeB]|uniref:Dihydroorotate dehydrogenase B (NAD(+)), electron transfer subunit n=1 Tax=Fervidicella metallireducens AeB TaxID=1403537 RepID=A0A017RTP5_9CLOT|nr:dihydroorotate dehydrogenase electron transfer subunit [Fervidicella metallireducens]EYE87971.1 diguanylate cyclase [Fervidicella metallireducens AeB]
MQYKYERVKIQSNAEVANNIYKLVIECNHEAKPGQFYMLRGWDNELLLGRPISVHDVQDGLTSFLYEVRGKGTKILSTLETGYRIEIFGPHGKGFNTNVKGKVAVVTGGIGIAPMYYTIKALKNAQIDLFAGFRDEVYLIDDLKDFISSSYVATNNGRIGHKGFITDIFNPWEYNLVLCCGPEIMMEKIVRMCRDYKTPVYVSMERHMACGIGACLVCTCKTKDGNKRVCKDGPVFSGEDVFLDA